MKIVQIRRAWFFIVCSIVLVITSSFIFSSCKNDDEDSVLTPTITSFTPTSGVVGTTVIITGTNFSATVSNNTVTLNGTAATVTAASETQLTITVPTSATTGKIVVSIGGNSVTSSSDFTVTTSTTLAPTITSFSPTSGAAGTTVTIIGTNFSATAANNTVTFNGFAATVTAATVTQLTVTVSSNATTGKIGVAVSTSSSTATSTDDFTVTTTSTSACNATNNVEQVVCLANAFKATLSSSQVASLEITLNLTNAKRWSNLPCALSCRNGLLFSGLSTAQQTAALALIQAASGTSSGEGYDEFNQIRRADDYLGQTASGYGSGNYIIAFLGTPSTTSKWMLQYGGHHSAQNITYDAGVVTSITPMHEAVEPKGAFTYNGTTYVGPMESEHNAMQDMLGSLSGSELTTAKISGTFSDCLMVPGSTSNTMPSTKQGIKVGNLSTAAQAKVLTAIAAWVNDVDPTTAATFLATYQNELANTYVSYASNTSAVAGTATSFLTANTDYVRIDGPSVWIEFACQNGVVLSGIHYHTVMRDHSRDYIGL